MKFETLVFKFKYDSERKTLTFFPVLNKDCLLDFRILLDLELATEPMREGISENIS